jgi:predicted enzyme related to lactoylglutathione lyase
MRRPLYSHVDLRVRDRERAVAFYDPILRCFGFELGKRVPGDDWPTWRRPGDGRNSEFFGFEVEADHAPNDCRVAFQCESIEDVDRITAVAVTSGAVDMDGPLYLTPTYYASFFDDPDGNKLEFCFLCEPMP